MEELTDLCSAKFATHDPKTGEVLRINADDDTMTLGEMVRQERMGAGMADQKNLDALYARQVMGDAKFEVSGVIPLCRPNS